MPYYIALFAGYAVALTGWWGIHQGWLRWPIPDSPRFEHPWREVGYAFVAVVGVLIVGQVFMQGWLLPEPDEAWWAPLTASLNQGLIFAPMLGMLLVRRQGRASAWVPCDRVGARTALGFGLGLCAMAAFLLVHRPGLAYATVLAEVYAWGNLPHAVQVFLEDLTIAIVFVRLRAGLGTLWTTVLVASLFAAGHIPAMLSGGEPMAEFVPLLADATLGTGIILVLQRSRDILWFWPVHFAMDMMQFYGTT
ncbi:MAG: hypothetical protein RhofKO_21850 [Rhodothermales bacterium]